MSVMVGNDIIEVERIKDSIEKLGEKFIKRIYTENEIEYCEKTKNMKYQHYAARFAAKEAIFKALSTLIIDKFKLEWTDFEVLNNEQGRPYVNVLNLDIPNVKIDVSLSHIKEYAIATAVAQVE